MYARAIERALFAAGAGLLVFWGLARVDSITASRRALNRFATLKIAAAERISATNPRNRDALSEDFALWSPERIRAYDHALVGDPDTPIAVLFIPKLHLRAPIFDGTDDLTLNRGVGRIPGTAEPGHPGNIAIAGHRDGFFRGLKDIGIGDEIDLEMPASNEAYFVATTQIVAPNNISVLKAHTVPALTLITCYPFYYVGDAPQRYVVTAFRKRKGELR